MFQWLGVLGYVRGLDNFGSLNGHNGLGGGGAGGFS